VAQDALNDDVIAEMDQLKRVQANLMLSPAGQELAIVKLHSQNEILRSRTAEIIKQLEKSRYTIINILIRSIRNVIIAKMELAFKMYHRNWVNTPSKANQWLYKTKRSTARGTRIWFQLLMTTGSVEERFASWRFNAIAVARYNSNLV